jgi:hypothetical protein
VNLDSHGHYIGAGGEAHRPLIEWIAPDQGMTGGLLVTKHIRYQL